MSMDELRKYNEAAGYDSGDISEKLIELSNLCSNVENPDWAAALYNDVEEALYQINAIAQNPYNKDFYRVLYNVLLAITGLDFD